MAIPTPGHTGGHCSFLVDGVLVSGDALVDRGIRCLSRSGPQLLPEMFSHDQDGCIRSLAALALLDTEILLPGHGDLWAWPESSRPPNKRPAFAQVASHNLVTAHVTFR